MRQNLLIGAGLGLVAAVVFASATRGTMVAGALLMFITPLPIALAGLGWGWRSAVVAGAVGTCIILVATKFALAVALAFALTQAAPIALLTYLALLSRPIAENGRPVSSDSGAAAVEWYPVGRLVIWALAMASLAAIYTLLVAGDLEGLRKVIADFIKTTFEAGLPRPGGQEPVPLGEAEIASLSEVMVYMLPPGSAVSGTVSLLFNLWLAGHITLASGQLGRPWPDLAALIYPQGTPLAFGVALVLATLLPGYGGLMASALAGGLFAAYLLLGLATVHYATRGRAWRPFALWALYASMPLTQFLTGFIIALVGIAETVFHLRARFAPPPTTDIST